MTTQIEISNIGGECDVKVEVVGANEKVILTPGSEETFLVHKTQRIMITEIPLPKEVKDV